MNNQATTLTEKESLLLLSICEGMDEPGSGWLHEVATPSLSTSGVLGSLVRKGLVESTDYSAPDQGVGFWVELTDQGWELTKILNAQG